MGLAGKVKDLLRVCVLREPASKSCGGPLDDVHTLFGPGVLPVCSSWRWIPLNSMSSEPLAVLQRLEAAFGVCSKMFGTTEIRKPAMSETLPDFLRRVVADVRGCVVLALNLAVDVKD